MVGISCVSGLYSFILPSVFSNVYLKIMLHVCAFIYEKYDKMIGAITRAG